MKAFLSLVSFSLAGAALAANVVSVQVKALDGFGGDTGSVVSRCQTKVGDAYDPVTATRDVTTLKSSGEFEEIAVDANQEAGGVAVVFYVKRKIRYREPLVVEGLDFFSESKIAKESELKDGFLYGEADLAAAAAKVRLAYLKKRFPDAKVTPQVTILSGNDATVKFLIDEGVRHKVRDIRFADAPHAVETTVFSRNTPWFSLAADEFDANEIREAISDYPWWNPIGWFSDDPVTEDQLAQCCDKIAEVYRNHGYLDVTVTGPVSEPTGEDEKVDLVYTVKEGPQYRVGGTLVTGLTKYTPDDVKSRSALPAAGTIAGQKELDDAAERVKITVGSGDDGLADTRVDVRRIPSETNPGTVDLVFVVREGVPVTLNEIKIRGNDYTMDKVIRREIALGPGDRMLEDRADRSKKRLENLDYFSRVRYYLEATDLGKDPAGREYRNLVYEVEEKNTGSFMVGIGASSVDSVYVSAEVNQNNFDLFAPTKLFRGAGQKARAYVAWGPRYQSYEIGFVEPWFLQRQLELSIDFYRRLRWYDQFDLVRSGGMASLTYPVKFWPTWNPFGRVGIGFSGEYIEMQDVQDGNFYTEDGERVSFYDEKHDYSKAFEPVIHLFWTKDNRDNFRLPSRGFRTRIYGDLGPGSKSSYWRLGFNHRHYWTVWKRYNHVFMAGIRAETIDAFKKDVPIYNRMFLGGPKSIRGIEYRYVSPMVRREYSNSWYPWGGQTLACLNFEYTVPIVKMFRVAAFSDLGSVGEDEFDLDFSNTFAWTAGLGLRLDIPMFPIRLDFGFPITKPDHADEEIFSFTVGYDF